MMLFVAHRGTSLISRIIAWVRPPYSHVELWFSGRYFSGFRNGKSYQTGGRGTVISADAEGVVAKTIPKLLDAGPGAVVDQFEYATPLTPAEESTAWMRACELVGTSYDFRMLAFGFLLKAKETESSRRSALCSGLCVRVARDIKRPVIKHVNPDSVSPADVVHSPALRWVASGIIE